MGNLAGERLPRVYAVNRKEGEKSPSTLNTFFYFEFQYHFLRIS
jgi:hypothetical protein